MTENPGVDMLTQQMDKDFEARRENYHPDENDDIKISYITNNPDVDQMYDALTNATDVQLLKFLSAYKSGLSLGNIVREMVKRTATFDVTGEYDE